MQAVTELLAQEAALVGQFVAALGEEQEALRSGLLGKLEDFNRRKAELVAKLNGAESSRLAILKAEGHSENREGMEDWLRRHGGTEAAAGKHWEQLLSKAREARDLNNLNGQLIAMRLQSTTQALSALAIQTPASSLYGPDGQAAQATGSRIIDAA